MQEITKQLQRTDISNRKAILRRTSCKMWSFPVSLTKAFYHPRAATNSDISGREKWFYLMLHRKTAQIFEKFQGRQFPDQDFLQSGDFFKPFSHLL